MLHLVWNQAFDLKDPKNNAFDRKEFIFSLSKGNLYRMKLISEAVSPQQEWWLTFPWLSFLYKTSCVCTFSQAWTTSHIACIIKFYIFMVSSFMITIKFNEIEGVFNTYYGHKKHVAHTILTSTHWINYDARNSSLKHPNSW